VFVQTFPHPFHPVDDDGTPDPDVTVEVFQVRPDTIAEFLAWSGADELGVVNGGPVFLLPGTRPAAERLCGLGDFAVRRDTGSVRSWPADGFYQRYQPADG
jgi:hypothetical protein